MLHFSIVRFSGTRYWFIHFLRRLSLFLFLYVCIVMTVFVIGNFQNFLDSTLERILLILETTAMIGGISLFFLIILSLFLAVFGRELSIAVWISSSLGLFTLVMLLFFVKFLKAWLYSP